MSVCEQCGKEFTCAMRDGKDDTPCWCAALPKLALEDIPANASTATRTCLCPACLQAWIDSRSAI
jgi:hypothetical protein